MLWKARKLVWPCRAIVLGTVVLQFVDWPAIDSPWVGMALLYASALAIGLDALWTGVRKRADAGPSIGNLGPGGWAVFACLFWIVAVPAYIVAALRHVSGREPPASREPIDSGTWVALGLVSLVTMVMTFFAWMAERG